MNTLRTFTLSILALLLSALAITADAQPRQDALYIFRNDGTFNFFFFGDIDHIGYSKIDTLGVEQDDYVVQEVWAEDTLYRIPISAIDSVAFVTPENKVKADVFCPDESIVNYIVASDSVWWIELAANTPLSLIPKVGDKLLIDVSAPLIPDGFGGRVVGREQNANGYLIVTEPLNISDIYDRLVIKAAVATPDRVTAAAKGKGVNGLLDGTEINVPEETWNFPTYTKSGSLAYCQPVVNKGNISISLNITGTYSASFQPSLTYRACIFMDVEHGYSVDFHSVYTTTEETSISLTGSLEGRGEIGFSLRDSDTKSTAGVTDNKPSSGLNFKLGVGFYIEGAITGFELAYKNTKVAQTTVQATMSGPGFTSIADMLKPEGRFSYETKQLKDACEPTYNLPKPSPIGLLANNFTLAGGVYFKAETKIRIPLEKEAKVVPDVVWKLLNRYKDEQKPGVAKADTTSFGFSIGCDLGARLSLKAPWWLLFEKFKLEESQPYYKQMNENSEFGAEAYVKVGAELCLGPWKLGRPEEVKVPLVTRYLVPDIANVIMTVDDEEPIRPYRLRFTSGIRRNTILGVNVGYIVYDKEGVEASKKCFFTWIDEDVFDQDYKHFKNGTFYDVLDDIDPGKGEAKPYTAYPMVRLINGQELLVDKKLDFTFGPAAFDIENREIHVITSGGSFFGDDDGLHVNVVPNMQTVEVSSDADWIDNLFYSNSNDLYIVWKAMPDTVKYERRGIIRLKGFSVKTHDLLVEDSIIFVQERPTMELSADSLLFGLEGGARTITIDRTNLTNFTVSQPANEKWLRCTIKDKVITVTVDPTTEEYNGTYITVRGSTPEGMSVEKIIWVRQYEEDDEVPDPNGIKKIFFRASVKATSDRPDDSFLPWLGGTVDGYEMDVVITRDNFTINTTVVDNSTLHVECSGSQAGPFGSTAEATLSFDIINFNKKKVDLAKITNVKYTNNASVGSFFSAVNKINVSNVPLTNLSSKYIEAKGKLIQGVGFSNFLAVLTYSDGVEHISYEQDADNTAMIRISFNGNENDAWADVIDYDGYYGDDDDDNWAGGDDDDNWAEGGW